MPVRQSGCQQTGKVCRYQSDCGMVTGQPPDRDVKSNIDQPELPVAGEQCLYRQVGANSGPRQQSDVTTRRVGGNDLMAVLFMCLPGRLAALPPGMDRRQFPVESERAEGSGAVATQTVDKLGNHLPVCRLSARQK